jgi:hypothetical protein
MNCGTCKNCTNRYEGYLGCRWITIDSYIYWHWAHYEFKGGVEMAEYFSGVIKRGEIQMLKEVIEKKYPQYQKILETTMLLMG